MTTNIGQRGVTLPSACPDIFYTQDSFKRFHILSIRFQQCFALACRIVRVHAFFSVTVKTE